MAAWDAGLYDAKHSFVWKHGAALLELLAPRPGERILDLGCGTGHLTARVAAAGAEVVGLDASPAMVVEARRQYPGLRFEVADARAFAFPEPFDAVFSNAVLHWVKEPRPVIAGVARALKPGGRFVAELGGRGNVQAITGALAKSLPANAGIGEYAGLLEEGGLEVVYAVLFDRPTPLEGPEGMRHWVEMFAGEVLARVPPDRREAFLGQVEAGLRPLLYRDGGWVADYRRLRVVARRGS